MYLVLTQEFIICISTYQLFFSFSGVLWSFPTAHLTIPSPSAPSSLHSLLYPPLCAPFKTHEACFMLITHSWVCGLALECGWCNQKPPLVSFANSSAWGGGWALSTMVLNGTCSGLGFTHRASTYCHHCSEFKWAASLLASENTVSWSLSATFDFPPPLPPWSLGCGKRGHYTPDFKSTLIKSRKSSETELSTLIRLSFSFLLYNINLSTSFKPSSIVP